jgi:hypothetical protein
MKQLAIKPKISIAIIQKQRPVKDVDVIIQKLQKD